VARTRLLLESLLEKGVHNVRRVRGVCLGSRAYWTKLTWENMFPVLTSALLDVAELERSELGVTRAPGSWRGALSERRIGSMACCRNCRAGKSVVAPRGAYELGGQEVKEVKRKGDLLQGTP
jgi:hypothetical protein